MRAVTGPVEAVTGPPRLYYELELSDGVLLRFELPGDDVLAAIARTDLALERDQRPDFRDVALIDAWLAEQERKYPPLSPEDRGGG